MSYKDSKIANAEVTYFKDNINFTFLFRITGITEIYDVRFRKFHYESSFSLGPTVLFGVNLPYIDRII